MDECVGKRASPCSISRGFIAFLALSIGASILIYRSALWGDRLLAPLDVAPNLFSKFRWMDPQASGIPKNHYTVDMFDFELPRQFAAYQSLQMGEFPWWEPYSDGGHPLAAEAHNNLTDPLRLLLYHIFPFVLAYNWVPVIHSLLAGLGMFLLLRHLGFNQFSILFGALSFQFAASHAIWVFPPCVEASFLYFPFLWLLWSSFLERPSFVKLGLSSLLCGAIFLCGDQQTHAYLPLFALCFCVGYGWSSAHTWKAVVQVTFVSGLLGALLALPVLLPQVEIFSRSKLQLVDYGLSSPASGILGAIGAFFPWLLGTFRTIDLSKATYQSGLGFSVYIGTAGALLACIGIGWRLREQWSKRPELRTSVLLILCYHGLICSTPLVRFLYTRSSDLSVLGLIVCCARGLDLAVSSHDRRGLRLFLLWPNLLLLTIVIALNAFSFAIYPRLVPRLKARVLAGEGNRVALPVPKSFRTFQVENWPNEVTARNPETVFALVSGLALLIFFRYPRHRLVRAGALTLNLLPLLLFTNRFLPNSPISSWALLLNGGPEQNAVRALLDPASGRLEERGPDMVNCIFPGATAIYYHVHTFTSYASFFLKTAEERQHLPPSNLIYLTTGPGVATGRLDKSRASEQLRFIWHGEAPRRITIAKETFNSVWLNLEPGPAGEILRTDSYYPGWSVVTPGVNPVPGNIQCFSVPAGVDEVQFRYRPRFLSQTLLVSALTAAGIVLGCAISLQRRKRSPESVPANSSSVPVA